MVGFEPKGARDNLKKRHFVAAGSSSGFITCILFQPLDVLKIRLQLQIEPVRYYSPRSKYKGISHAMKCIYKEEGMAAFWKGFTPATFLSTTHGGLQFLSFEMLTKYAWNYLPGSVLTSFKPMVNFSCGALSGCLATAGSFPFDVLRTRMVGQGEPKLYSGMFNAAMTMLAKEGPRSFYKGLFPALLQITPATGSRFAFYKLFEDSWITVIGQSYQFTDSVRIVLCGSSAGITTKVIVYPLDVIKKRLQVQGFEEARRPFGAVQKSFSFVHCLKTIVKQESFLGLYKGLSPGILKTGFTTGSHFFFYEEIRKLLAYLQQTR